jgi:hypothetical protein
MTTTPPADHSMNPFREIGRDAAGLRLNRENAGWLSYIIKAD